MGNAFVHVELMSTDAAKAKSFYGELFDWDLEDMSDGDEGTYTLIRVGVGTGGGLMQNPIPGAPSMWVPYVLVDDLEATAARAELLGATVMKGPTEVPGIGRFVIVNDPTGGMLGLWKTMTS